MKAYSHFCCDLPGGIAVSEQKHDFFFTWGDEDMTGVRFVLCGAHYAAV